MKSKTWPPILYPFHQYIGLRDWLIDYKALKSRQQMVGEIQNNILRYDRCTRCTIWNTSFGHCLELPIVEKRTGKTNSPIRSILLIWIEIRHCSYCIYKKRWWITTEFLSHFTKTVANSSPTYFDDICNFLYLNVNMSLMKLNNIQICHLFFFLSHQKYFPFTPKK